MAIYLSAGRKEGLEAEHAIADVFNAGGYDAVTLGNHDFNFGYEYLEHHLNALNARCICAVSYTHLSMKFGEKGIMHGFESIMLKDENGEPAPVYSIASGLDYPSVGPEHAFLHDLGRVKYETVSDEQAMEAFFKLSRYEGIIPAIESSHAVAYAMRRAKEMRQGSILVCLSGRGDKDIDYVVEHYGYGDQFLD